MQKKMIYNFSMEPTGTHMLLLSNINPKSKVLDIGAASGYLGEYLMKYKDCEVWGIEPERQSCNEASKKNYRLIINKRVEEALLDMEGQKFDYILAGDVLEHLEYPEKILFKLHDFLKEDGRLISSLPNVAHYSVRIPLLFGKWKTADSGILDKTHLHFYNSKGAKALFEGKGWKIESVRPRGDLERWGRKVGLERIGKFLLYVWPELFAIQFIFVLKK